jgi:hypothetical protein
VSRRAAAITPHLDLRLNAYSRPTDWYDNEHIPLRTSSLEAFVSAARFVALDEQEPKWSAMYSISDNTLFGKEEYTKLRANRSPREAKLVASLAVLDRRASYQTRVRSLGH